MWTVRSKQASATAGNRLQLSTLTAFQSFFGSDYQETLFLCMFVGCCDGTLEGKRCGSFTTQSVQAAVPGRQQGCPRGVFRFAKTTRQHSPVLSHRFARHCRNWFPVSTTSAENVVERRFGRVWLNRFARALFRVTRNTITAELAAEASKAARLNLKTNR